MSFTRENTGTLTQVDPGASTDAVCNFGFTTTVGRLLVTLMAIDKSGTISTPESGWTLDAGASAANTSVSSAVLWRIADAAVSSATHTKNNSNDFHHQTFEFSFTGATPVVEGSANAYDDGLVLTVSSGTASGLDSSNNQLVLYAFGMDTGSTNNFSSLTNSASSISHDMSFGQNPGFSTAERINVGLSSAESTITVTAGSNSDQMCGCVIVFHDTGTSIPIPLGPVW